MSQISQQWLESAQADLFVIDEIISKDYLTHMVAFHCQQSVEKSLKSLLEHFGQRVPKIHTINRLSKLTKRFINLDNGRIINLLDELYTESRYPGDFGLLPNGKPTLKEAQEIFDFAKKVYKRVRGIVNE